MLVHCLDGVDRTGLFLAAFTLAQKQMQEQVVDIPWSVLNAKDANPKFVGGSNQLKCLRDVALELQQIQSSSASRDKLTF